MFSLLALCFLFSSHVCSSVALCELAVLGLQLFVVLCSGLMKHTFCLAKCCISMVTLLPPIHTQVTGQPSQRTCVVPPITSQPSPLLKGSPSPGCRWGRRGGLGSRMGSQCWTQGCMEGNSQVCVCVCV